MLLFDCLDLQPRTVVGPTSGRADLMHSSSAQPVLNHVPYKPDLLFLDQQLPSDGQGLQVGQRVW